MTAIETPAPLPKIYVWCNSCQPQWHHAMAMAEDGTHLASHICSHHGFIPGDVGINPGGWKRDLYEAHYPGGFEVVWIEDARTGKCPGLDHAYELNQVMGAAAEAARAATP